MSTRVKIRLEKCQLNENDLMTIITSIQHPDETISYGFPTNVKLLSSHPELADISAIKKADKSMTKKGQYRNITIHLPDTVSKLYFDEDGNFVYKDFYLEEIQQITTNTTSFADYTQLEIMKTIKDLREKTENKEQDLSKIQKLFILEKFVGKSQNVDEWIRKFEREAERYHIVEEDKLIQILRFFLEKSALDWYNATMYDLTLESSWGKWKDSFVRSFLDDSWSPLRYAYSFRYIAGSYVEYALKKERLLLQSDPEIPTQTRINVIGVGLKAKLTFPYTRNLSEHVSLL